MRYDVTLKGLNQEQSQQWAAAMIAAGHAVIPVVGTPSIAAPVAPTAAASWPSAAPFNTPAATAFLDTGRFAAHGQILSHTDGVPPAPWEGANVKPYYTVSKDPASGIKGYRAFDTVIPGRVSWLWNADARPMADGTSGAHRWKANIPGFGWVDLTWRHRALAHQATAPQR